MKKLTFVFGVAVGFVAGSRMGRGPYEQLEGAARQIINQPKVQETLQTAADSAGSVRDAAADATTGAMDDASRAATKKIDDASRRIRSSSNDVGSGVGSRA